MHRTRAPSLPICDRAETCAKSNDIMLQNCYIPEHPVIPNFCFFSPFFSPLFIVEKTKNKKCNEKRKQSDMEFSSRSLGKRAVKQTSILALQLLEVIFKKTEDFV